MKHGAPNMPVACVDVKDVAAAHVACLDHPEVEGLAISVL